MLNMRAVETGIVASKSLADQVTDELDAGYWTHETLDVSAASDLADYVVGATQAVGSNLQTLMVHFTNYSETRYQQDADFRLNVSKEGKPYPSVPDSRHDERELRLDAYERAFFVSLGSTLDTLAAAVIGFTGLGLDIHHADFGWLLPMSPDNYPSKSKNERLWKGLAAAEPKAREEQLKVVRAVAAALEASGPAGWVDWALAMRNMYVHREHRSEQILLGRDKSKTLTVDRLPPLDPDMSNLQGLRSAKALMAGLNLTEDIETTMKGLVESLNAAVTGVIEVLRHLWERRKADPALITQPTSQWRVRSSQSAFAGYAPGSAVVKKGVTLVMNPKDARRLDAAGLISNRPGTAHES
jgi:hypothetical protein